MDKVLMAKQHKYSYSKLRFTVIGQDTKSLTPLWEPNEALGQNTRITHWKIWTRIIELIKFRASTLELTDFLRDGLGILRWWQALGKNNIIGRCFPPPLPTCTQEGSHLGLGLLHECFQLGIIEVRYTYFRGLWHLLCRPCTLSGAPHC